MLISSITSNLNLLPSLPLRLSHIPMLIPSVLPSLIHLFSVLFVILESPSHYQPHLSKAITIDNYAKCANYIHFLFFAKKLNSLPLIKMQTNLAHIPSRLIPISGGL